MQNTYSTETMARIRMQERQDEAIAERMAASVGQRRGVLGRVSATFWNMFRSDDDADEMEFVPRIADYPTRDHVAAHG